MKTLISLILLTISFAVNAISYDDFRQPRALTRCYVIHDTPGNITNVLVVTYSKPLKDPLGNVHRDLSGYEYVFADDQVTLIRGSGISFDRSRTPGGVEDTRLSVTRHTQNSITYFGENAGVDWEQVSCDK